MNKCKKLEEYSKDIPVFKSANMSYDINLMAKIVANFGKRITRHRYRNNRNTS